MLLQDAVYVMGTVFIISLILRISIIVLLENK